MTTITSDSMVDPLSDYTFQSIKGMKDYLKISYRLWGIRCFQPAIRTVELQHLNQTPIPVSLKTLHHLVFSIEITLLWMLGCVKFNRQQSSRYIKMPLNIFLERTNRISPFSVTIWGHAPIFSSFLQCYLLWFRVDPNMWCWYLWFLKLLQKLMKPWTLNYQTRTSK